MENIFNVSYNSKLDKLEIRKEKKVNKLIKSIQKNKFISLIFASFILLSGINFYLIYNFMKILENIWKALKYVAKCIDNNVASQGRTIEESIKNLKEALELYMQDEEPVKPKEIFVTTLEVAVWVQNIQYCHQPK